MNDFPAASTSPDWSGFGRLTSVPESLAALAPYCQPVPPVQCPVEAATGRIAAAPVYAQAPTPAFPVALRDGWAVAAHETIGASSSAPTFANAPPIRVAFGARAPSDANAVLPLNGVNAKVCPAEIFETTAPGDGLRYPGGDFSAGDLIVAGGEAVRPDRAAFLGLTGFGVLSVRIPRVAILAAGGCGDWIAAMARREGADCIVVPEKAGREELNAAACDMFIAIGEPGRAALGKLAASGSFSSYAVAMRPGQTVCGIVSRPSNPDGTVFVLTPERFECVFPAWLLLVRPCLRNLAGTKGCDPRQSLPLTRKITSSPGWSDFVLLRVRKTPDGGENLYDRGEAWEPLACADIAWSAIARADAWLAVAAESEGYASGQHVFAEFL